MWESEVTRIEERKKCLYKKKDKGKEKEDIIIWGKKSKIRERKVG